MHNDNNQPYETRSINFLKWFRQELNNLEINFCNEFPEGVSEQDDERLMKHLSQLSDLTSLISKELRDATPAASASAVASSGMPSANGSEQGAPPEELTQSVGMLRSREIEEQRRRDEASRQRAESEQRQRRHLDFERQQMFQSQQQTQQLNNNRI